MSPDPHEPTSTKLREHVDAKLTRFLAARTDELVAVSPSLGPLTEVASDLIAGGKRIRPAFGYWGHVAVSDSGIPEGIWSVLAALEMLHVGVLIHDDVLDSSDTRRGRPAAHRQFEAWAAVQAIEHPERFGTEIAVLLGDQLMAWADEMATTAELDPQVWARAARYWYLMRTEVNSGQVLDICAQYRLSRGDPQQIAWKVLEEKTSRYTVQRPLQLGAAIGGADESLQDALGVFGIALGRAFQLRDDLLGVFAPSAQTGKPAAGDLREGKRTVLLTRATHNLGNAATELESLLGPGMDDDQVERATQLITSSGAVEQLEEMIAADHAAALQALDHPGITQTGRIALTELARQCVERDS
ncbi:hypothetical protein HMPREF1531_01908 [Propionibacterium sp. oral taxon 192 str. F0372]|uniref:polyprenyl synthetase family protein n=1 Tax=Propionibacterium sp. oral taxon 192 TaxID=671222 RepID=UPI0003528C90|nr:polyprenyl synthetase family protein [Propionibacterium sp. oral taxon 192]EPH02600.1 hypothetical protein HMPREF1531_01908 [Propionibacterium sp. oral taxon 192 str. F0372]